ncbi:dienelactone hydrolase family protein [Photobacterium angustum]|uniref:Dienelactone hydrolase domain-containing protein n=1 Tax=Photobacterium angustum TaxID=661 RepID=A0ABX5H1P7_PHOAN|nr:dienelactone hydrolase family protein [Photobacterium angustum]PSX06434.1 hypothetical protein C0W27_17085 [Photobacterium angustum]
MKVIIVTDIFGLCETTDKMASFIAQHTDSVKIVDPYQGVRCEFSSEKAAYEQFIKDCGHDDYLSLVRESVLKDKPDVLIGFSAGANAAWRISELVAFDCKSILCFYPSQIRNHVDIEPKVPTAVIFPKKEASFDVLTMNTALLNRINVTTQIMPYKHGFMNCLSDAYDKQGETMGFEYILNRIRKI